MSQCPCCQETSHQNKAGQTQSGSQRYRCLLCQRKYTPEPKQHGYPESLRQQVAAMYVDGRNLPGIAHHLKIHHQTVALRVKSHAEKLPAAPVPEEVHTAELGEMYTFIGDKKLNFHLDHRRSSNALYFGLASGLDTYPGSNSTDC